MLASHQVEESLLKPVCFGKFIVKCPCLLCAIIFFIFLIVMIIDAQVFELSENAQRTYLVESSEYVINYDSYTLAAQFIADNSVDNSSVPPQTESDDFWLYQHMFKLIDYKDDFDIDNPDKTDYWILTKENIETIIKYENMIAQDPVWKNQFCLVCSPIITIFYLSI